MRLLSGLCPPAPLMAYSQTPSWETFVRTPIRPPPHFLVRIDALEPHPWRVLQTFTTNFQYVLNNIESTHYIIRPECMVQIYT